MMFSKDASPHIAHEHVSVRADQAVNLQSTSPSQALETLKKQPDAQLVDIRMPNDARQQGSPDLKGTGKSIISMPYKPPTRGSGDSGTMSVGWGSRASRMQKVRITLFTKSAAPTYAPLLRPAHTFDADFLCNILHSAQAGAAVACQAGQFVDSFNKP